MPIKLVRVLNGHTICLLIDNEEKVFQIARISAGIDPAACYVQDMLRAYPFRIEMVGQDLIEVYFQADKEYNLSDQMIFIGLAFPTSPDMDIF